MFRKVHESQTHLLSLMQPQRDVAVGSFVTFSFSIRRVRDTVPKKNYGPSYVSIYLSPVKTRWSLFKGGKLVRLLLHTTSQDLHLHTYHLQTYLWQRLMSQHSTHSSHLTSTVFSCRALLNLLFISATHTMFVCLWSAATFMFVGIFSLGFNQVERICSSKYCFVAVQTKPSRAKKQQLDYNWYLYR